MPDIEQVQPILSSTVAQGGAADRAGTVQYQPGVVSEAAGDVAFAGPIADFILYGVVNGAFAQGPPDPNANIEPINNPLPYWTGPTQVSGGAITCQWAVDASSPSGYNLRFSIAAGAAGDEAYFEQIVPIAGGRLRKFGNYCRGEFVCVSVSGGAVRATFDGQYLTAAGATTGVAFTDTRDFTGASSNNTSVTSATGPPADAFYLRMRYGVKRNTMAAADVAVIDLCDVRMDRGGAVVLLPEQTTPASFAAGQMYQTGGYILMYPGGNSSTYIQIGPDSNGDLKLYAAGNVVLNGAGGVTALTGSATAVTAYLPVDIQTYQKFSNVITPATLTGNVDNYSPTGIDTCGVLMASASGATRNVTGLTNGVEGRRLTFAVSAAGAATAIKLVHNATSTVGNRFTCPGEVDLTLAPGTVVDMVYLTVSGNSRWRVIGTP